MNEFTEGFLLQASLILALGAQNLFVLESGLKRRRQFLVATICSACDLLLIALGVVGAASIFVQVPIIKISFGIIGVAFLFYYGFKKLAEGFRKNQSEEIHTKNIPSSIRQTVFLSIGFSLLNPHVYLDTVLLICGYSSKFLELFQRMKFGAGAGSFSVL